MFNRGERRKREYEVNRSMDRRCQRMVVRTLQLAGAFTILVVRIGVVIFFALARRNRKMRCYSPYLYKPIAQHQTTSVAP